MSLSNPVKQAAAHSQMGSESRRVLLKFASQSESCVAEPHFQGLGFVSESSAFVLIYLMDFLSIFNHKCLKSSSLNATD